MKKSIIILFASSLLFLVSAIQDMRNPGFFKELEEKLAKFQELYPEEKLYIQTDKPFYEPGDAIWFNVFALNSNGHRPTNISDVVYVDLIDPKGNISKSLSLLIKEGTANGDFQLPDSDRGGTYKLRAYTQWMKNLGEDEFFTKELPVQRVITPRLLLKLDFEKEAYGPGDTVVAELEAEDLKNVPISSADITFKAYIAGELFEEHSLVSAAEGKTKINFSLPDQLYTTDGLLNIIVSYRGIEESISRSIPIVLNDINLSFFPEGGDAIASAKSSIAFKALNEFDKGADVAGAIVDDQGKLITNFESFHMGMGKVEMTYEPGRSYFARIDQPMGDHKLVPLPQPLERGLSLMLHEKTPNRLSWHIYASEKQDAYLVSTTHGKLSYSKALKLDKGLNEVSLNTNNFPVGISVFTLFDQQKIPQAERLVFLNEDKGLNIELTTNKESYAPGELVKAAIKTTDNKGKPIVAKLSLAVVDDQLISFADDKQDHLLSQMLLSSEVKGEIQEPRFYFDPEEEKANRALDLLLMTQGWRRFSWAEIENPQRAYRFQAERLTDLSGYVRTANGLASATEVTLLELGGKRRIVTVQTTPTGNFLFRNVDPQQQLLLLTKNPGRVTIDRKSLNGGLAMGNDDVIYSPNAILLGQGENTDEEEPVQDLASTNINISLNPDSQSLGEVVVTGMGYMRKENITSSITYIENGSDIDLASPNFASTLMGQVPGIQISNSSGIAGSAQMIQLRGVSSISNGNSAPLFVIDGFIVDYPLDQVFASGDMVSPEDIESINVLGASASTAALYGSRGSNGVIVITTKKRSRNYRKKNLVLPKKYHGSFVQPRKFSATRVFYTPPPAKNKNAARKDFRKTVYWNHEIITDEKGRANISFYNTDAVSAFRLTAEGFTGKGDLGRAEHTFSTIRPLSLDARFPAYLGYEDRLELPVTITNETKDLISGQLNINLPEGLSMDGKATQAIDIAAGKSKVVYLKVRPDGIEGAFPVSMSFSAGRYTDEIKHTFNVRPVGFPRSYSLSGKSLSLADSILLSNLEAQSLKAQLNVYPTVLTDLFSGADAILRQPHGCFEQVSSSNYPNILALQFMRETGQVDPKLEKRALAYLKIGYNKLTSYEVQGGGFDWFGHPPAHAGLTAFGLVQFAEMKKVMDGVSDEMIERTQEWLLSRRNGEGGFETNPKRFDGNGTVSNAYIVFGLTQTGEADLELEYTTALNEAERSGDMYRMALLALSAHNLGKQTDYKRLIDRFIAEMEHKSITQLDAWKSVTWGYGRNLRVELASLWTLALMREQTDDLALVEELIDYIIVGRKGGRFGSTQATALSLQALTEYARHVKNQREDGDIDILVNGIIASSLSYKAEETDPLSTADFATSLIQDEKQEIKVHYRNGTKPLPYTLDLSWYTKLPPSSENVKVRISTSIITYQVALNETVRFKASLENLTAEDQPMPMAIIGIPAGLSVQPWQLKELQEKGIFDFYELINGRLVLYFRSIEAAQTRTVNLDLKADVPGSFQAAASSAYLYYDDEFVHFIAGEKIEINP